MTKKRNIVLILVVSTLVMLSFWGSLGYILFYSVNNEIKLEQEFSEIDNMIDENGLDDPDLDTKLNTYVSSHNYLVVEQAVKAYLRDLLKESRNLYNLYNDEKLTDLITIENFKTDGKEFIKSQSYLEESQVQLQNIENNQLYFESDNLLDKYNHFFDDFEDSYDDNLTTI